MAFLSTLAAGVFPVALCPLASFLAIVLVAQALGAFAFAFASATLALRPRGEGAFLRQAITGEVTPGRPNKGYATQDELIG